MTSWWSKSLVWNRYFLKELKEESKEKNRIEFLKLTRNKTASHSRIDWVIRLHYLDVWRLSNVRTSQSFFIRASLSLKCVLTSLWKTLHRCHIAYLQKKMYRVGHFIFKFPSRNINEKATLFSEVEINGTKKDFKWQP